MDAGDTPEAAVSPGGPAGRAPAAPWLSVIVPTLDEGQCIAATLQRAVGPGIEVIVVDGGSRDDTRRVAQRYAARLLEAPPGRASQMNTGAAAASGSVFLFLHADTLLPRGYAEDVRTALSDPHVVAGRFDIRLDTPGLLYACIGRLISMRSRASGVATGDQAIFIRRPVFERLGGYPPLALMEDIALCRAAGREGRVACLRSQVITSARRWKQHGPLRTIVRMWILRLLYYSGVDANRLRAMYPNHGATAAPLRSACQAERSASAVESDALRERSEPPERRAGHGV
jgi:rSAM/selenodomain-associated transferase 2